MGEAWRDLLAQNLTQSLNMWVLKSRYKRTQIAVKTKAFIFVTTNETVINNSKNI